MLINYRMPVYKFSTSAGNLDGFFRKTFKNLENILLEFRLSPAEPFRTDALVNFSASVSLISIVPLVIVKRRRSSRRFCLLIRICFNVPASKSSTLSFIAADVSTNLHSYRNAA